MYQALLADARQNPHDADYHGLRMAYARSDDYHPYFQDVESVNALNHALHEGDMEAVLDAAHKLLEVNYLDIEAHMTADYAYLQLEDPARSAYHRAFAKGLFEAILATGTGRDFATAFIVLSIPEEYTILRVHRGVSEGQRLVEHEGHWFDILAARLRESGETRDFYFNIDLPRRWLADQSEDDDS